MNLVERLNVDIGFAVIPQDDGLQIDPEYFGLLTFTDLGTDDVDIIGSRAGCQAACPLQDIENPLRSLIRNGTSQTFDLTEKMDLLTIEFCHSRPNPLAWKAGHIGDPGFNLLDGLTLDTQPTQAAKVDSTIGSHGLFACPVLTHLRSEFQHVGILNQVI